MGTLNTYVYFYARSTCFICASINCVETMSSRIHFVCLFKFTFYNLNAWKAKNNSFNRPFPSCFEPHYDSEASCKVFIMQTTLIFIRMKTNFHNKNFARSLAVIMRFKATGKKLKDSGSRSHVTP